MIDRTGATTIGCEMEEPSSRSGMGNWETCAAVERQPDRVSGAWVFRGTRVPVAALFENLRDGVSVDGFLECFPGVQRSQVEAVLDHEAASTMSSPRP